VKDGYCGILLLDKRKEDKTEKEKIKKYTHTG
jgi:hypothetical protein